MSVPFFDLSRQIATIRRELDEAITGVVEGGRFVSGPEVEQFELEFAAACGAPEAVGVASGTDALSIALQAVGVGPGDEVITAANTCVPTVAAIESAGASPVLADVDPQTRTLDPDRLPELLTERSRAIVPVHLYGQCADMDPILALAGKHGLSVVEDAAQAHGARYRDRPAGTLADAAAFSFYPTKNLGAFGDGGAIVTARADVAEKARRLRTYGESERYRSLCSGRNSRLDTLQAAILTVKLSHLSEWTARRREIAGRYLSAFADASLALPTEAEGRHHVYHLFVVAVANRDAVQEALRQAGVQTLVHYPRPVHFHPAYEHLAANNGRLEQSERLSGQVLSLPLFPELEEREIDAVIDAVQRTTG